MSLTVYGAPLSPFVRKVRLLLNEKGLDYQLEVITPTGQPDWYAEISPLNRIPALRDGKLALADSSVICQYLEQKHPDLTPLYGSNAVDTAQIRWLEKYADYELAPLTTFAIFRNRVVKPGLMKQPSDESAVLKALNEKLPAHFDYLEKQLGTLEYFIGEHLSIADLAIACQLINMEHGGETLDPERWPNLASLLERIKARDSVQAVLPGELRILHKLATPA